MDISKKINYKHVLIFVLSCILLITSVLFFNAYKKRNYCLIKKIVISGEKNIPDGIIDSIRYKPGDVISSNEINKLLHDLYQTNIFRDIKIEFNKKILSINLYRKPIIGKLVITGDSKIIKNSSFNSMIDLCKLKKGLLFDNSNISMFVNSLKSYFNSNLQLKQKISVDIKNIENNTVNINIDINDGTQTRLYGVKIVGNNSFSELNLIKNHFSDLEEGFFTKIGLYKNSDNAYKKLEASVNSLKKFYLNNGYAKFRIISSKVVINNEDNTSEIKVVIDEGKRYKIAGSRIIFLNKNIILPENILHNLNSFFTIDEYFSKDNIDKFIDSVNSELVNYGYINSGITIAPEINENNNTIFIIVKINKEKGIKIRRINFVGNYKTNDEVLRSTITKCISENEFLTEKKLEESKRKILNIPSKNIKNVVIIPSVVDESNGLVDLNYSLTEIPTFLIQGGIGYSQKNKTIIEGEINQTNLFGTGKILNSKILLSKPDKSVQLNYYNPYLTLSGIGHNLRIVYKDFDSSIVTPSHYMFSELSFGESIIIPLTINSSYSVNFGIKKTKLYHFNSKLFRVHNFILKHGDNLKYGQLSTLFNYDTKDKAIFPESGTSLSLEFFSSIPFFENSLSYYKISSNYKKYAKLFLGITGNLKMNFSYGNSYSKNSSDYPFFENFYLGGIGSVRGFISNSIGPKEKLISNFAEDLSCKNLYRNNKKIDNTCSVNGACKSDYFGIKKFLEDNDVRNLNEFSNNKGLSVGGNIQGLLSVEINLPKNLTFIENSRLGLFFDAGFVSKDTISISDFRGSCGVFIDWMLPIGAALNINISYPIIYSVSDDIEKVQFGLGLGI